MDDNDDIVGIDGCKAGWIVAATKGVVVVPRLDPHRFSRVGIDIPIGLVDGPPRACDIEARKYLGRAGSSVFPAPPRAALTCADYRSALTASLSATGRGISMQTFNIMAKVSEVDRLIDPSNADAFVEVHPECSFKMLNDGHGLPSKKIVEGQISRRRLLSDHFDVPSAAPPGAAIDDLLDAYAVLWSMRRFQRGDHRVFGDGRRDTRGIEMRIVC